MRIEEEIKLDYSDVLFRPKRSTLKSRKDVDLNRKYTFKHSRSSWKGIPIIASNMDGVGEIDVAKKLSCGYPTPVCILVVHTLPGPIPTLTISAPLNTNS